MFKSTWSKVLGGAVLGAVVAPLLKTASAKKVYTNVAAGVIIAKDYILEEAEVLQGAATDVIDDAKLIVEDYYKKQDAAYEETFKE